MPGLWLAKPFMIGSGVGGLKIAEFGNFHIPSEDSYAVKQQLSRSLGSEWHPFIEEWSKRDGEWSLIYMKTDAEKVSVLIMTSDSDEGLTVVEMKLSPKALDRWVDDPVNSAKHKNATESKDSWLPKQVAEDHTAEDQTDTQIATTHAAR